MIVPAARNVKAPDRICSETEKSIHYFNELVHVGWQATLPVSRSRGFRPVFSSTERGQIQSPKLVDIANSNYESLPDRHKAICTGTTSLLTSFLMRAVCEYRKLDDDVIEEGQRMIHKGWVFGKFGKARGGYDTSIPEVKCMIPESRIN